MPNTLLNVPKNPAKTRSEHISHTGMGGEKNSFREAVKIFFAESVCKQTDSESTCLTSSLWQIIFQVLRRRLGIFSGDYVF